MTLPVSQISYFDSLTHYPRRLARFILPAKRDNVIGNIDLILWVQRKRVEGKYGSDQNPFYFVFKSSCCAPAFLPSVKNLYLKQWWRGLTHSKGGRDYYCSKCSQINLLDLFFQLFLNILSRLEKENLLEYKRKAVRLLIYDRGLWVKTRSLFSSISLPCFQVLTRYKNHIATSNRTW